MTVLRGLHINNADDSAVWRFLDSAGKGNVALVKVVTPNAGQLRKLRDEYGVVTTIGRFLLPNVDLAPTPEIAAERWYRQLRERLAPLTPYLDYLEVPVNEAYERGQALTLYAAASARFVELAASDGIKCLVANFARGNPEPEEFPRFLPALQAAKRYGGGLSVHEYFHRGKLDATWQIGRIQRLYATVPEDLRVPVYITEYGCDSGDLPGYTRRNAGWRGAGYASAAEYALDLDAGVRLYDAACPYVRGVCVFNLGDFDETWRSFDLDTPEIPRWIASGPRPTVPVPPTERPFNSNPNGYSVGAGFVAEATRRKTQLLSDEMYLNGPRGALSVAVTGDGLLVWTQAGGVRLARFE